MQYHAHVYWRNSQQKQIALDLILRLKLMGCDVGRVHDKPIGPHTLPMYQVTYDSAIQERVEQFLDQNRQDLSILLHESINDDVRDHTEGARWLGQPLLLDLIWLDRYSRGIL
jgi:DOPA 4,5-dioxygenase